jgi:NAD(P)-dependent dehydrogenase (short-subunit alcohol dehydrogenase family)
MSDKKVIVYGASGYTGRLVCEYLREFHVPFVAAGRDKARIAEALHAVPGIGIYSATKSGVDRLTRVAAMESGKLGYGVRVNCIYPGLVPTAMGAGLASDVARLGLFGSPEEAVGAVVGLTPSGRLGEVGDMASAVVFLASDAAGFINGVGLPVDGGMGM